MVVWFEDALEVCNESKVLVDGEGIVQNVKRCTIADLSINGFRVSMNVLSFEYYLN